MSGRSSGFARRLGLLPPIHDDHPQTRRRQRPPRCLADVIGVDALTFKERHFDRQLALGEARDVGNSLAKRIDDRGITGVGRADQKPAVFDGAVNGTAFLAYIERCSHQS